MNVFQITGFLFIFAALSVCASQTDDEAWLEYKLRFGKILNRDDDSLRKEQFLKTHRMISEHNASGKPWRLGHNHFSDWTDEERRKFVGAGRKPTDEQFKKRVFERDLSYTITPFKVSSFDAADYPATLDYRTGPCALPPAKDQGGCGSCYVFGAIAPVEFNVCRKLGKMIVLSEQQVLDCSAADGACSGGDEASVWRQLHFIGLVSNETYGPYKAKNGFCDYCNLVQPNLLPVRPVGTIWLDNPENGVTTAQAIVAALNKFCPLAAGINVVDNLEEFMQFEDGVFDDPSCEPGGGHAVNIVGYGTTEEHGIDYWVYRNSWSDSWGKDGYGIIRRGVNRCGIESSARAVIVDYV